MTLVFVEVALIVSAVLVMRDFPQLVADRRPSADLTQFEQQPRTRRAYVRLAGSLDAQRPLPYSLHRSRRLWGIIPISWSETPFIIFPFRPDAELSPSRPLILVRRQVDRTAMISEPGFAVGMVSRPDRTLDELLVRQGIAGDVPRYILDVGDGLPSTLHEKLLVGVLIGLAILLLVFDGRFDPETAEWTPIGHVRPTRSTAIVFLLLCVFLTSVTVIRWLGRDIPLWDVEQEVVSTAGFGVLLIFVSVLLSHRGVSICPDGFAASIGILPIWRFLGWHEIQRQFRLYSDDLSRVDYTIISKAGEHLRFSLPGPESGTFQDAIVDRLHQPLLDGWTSTLRAGGAVDLAAVQITNEGGISCCTLRGWDSIPFEKIATWMLTEKSLQISSLGGPGAPPTLLTASMSDVSFPQIAAVFIDEVMRSRAPNAQRRTE